MSAAIKANPLQTTLSLDVPRSFTNGKDETRVSSYSDREVYEWAKLQTWSRFLVDIATRTPFNALTQKQIACLHVACVINDERHAPPQVQPANDKGAYKPIADLFETAISHKLVAPRIKVIVPFDSGFRKGEYTYAFSRFTQRSQYAGQIRLTNGEQDGTYYGRIDLAGHFFPSQDGRADHVRELLQEFASAPGETAAKYGKLTGRCCFCSARLTADDSTDVGYGPQCARHYGLPWG